MDWTSFLFGFNGRIGRAEFWLGLLVMFCWMIFVLMLAASHGALLDATGSFSLGARDVFRLVDPETYRSPSSAKGAILVVKAVGSSLLLWLYLAIAIKRLHDRDRSGWWMLPFFVLPGLYDQFSDRLDDFYLVIPLGLIAGLLCLWGGIEMCFLKGSRKTNRFGPNPLLPTPAVVIRPRWDQQSEIEMVPHKAGPPPQWHVKRGHE
jgi:uncharacterized membrane protein YhaH (DUF805 family)